MSDNIYDAGSERVRVPAGITPTRAGGNFHIRSDGKDVVIRLMHPVDTSTDPDGVTHEVVADVVMHRDQFEEFVERLIDRRNALRSSGYRVGPSPN